MAKQRGPLRLDGKIGGMVFYKNRYGDIAKMIGTVSKEKYENDPKMKGRRETATEFGYASKVSSLLRVAVKGCCPQASVGTTYSALVGEVTKALKADTVNARGSRRL